MSFRRRCPSLALVVAIATIATIAILLPSQPAYAAASTGSPLVYQPVEPCRVLDTRAALGPIAANTAIDVYVRGSDLPANQGGHEDCHIPPDAEAVVGTVHVFNATVPGYLRLNGTGTVTSPNGAYARVLYNAVELDTVEMSIGLCNIYNFPHDHAPCGYDPQTGTYLDFQILNTAANGTSVHVAIDLVGYYRRMPLTTAVSGIVVSENVIAGEPPVPTARELLLDNGMRLTCQLPYSDESNCDVEVCDLVMAAGHVINIGGTIYVYAHNEVGVEAMECPDP